MNTSLFHIIQQYEKPGDFTHTLVTDDMIATAKQALGRKLPQQYISFLQMFGHGGTGGLEVMGFG